MAIDHVNPEQSISAKKINGIIDALNAASNLTVSPDMLLKKSGSGAHVVNKPIEDLNGVTATIGIMVGATYSTSTHELGQTFIFQHIYRGIIVGYSTPTYLPISQAVPHIPG